MSKILIIAEKPSVATDLAKVLSNELGKFEKKGKDRNTYFESDQAIISSAVGHLVELKMPSGPNGKKLPWGIKHLPVIPESFEIQPIAKSESRLNLLKRLIKRKEVDTVINACDAGREGELIFRYVIQISGSDKPLKRMWMQSMTNNSIISAFKSLRDDDRLCIVTYSTSASVALKFTNMTQNGIQETLDCLKSKKWQVLMRLVEEV